MGDREGSEQGEEEQEEQGRAATEEIPVKAPPPRPAGSANVEWKAPPEQVHPNVQWQRDVVGAGQEIVLDALRSLIFTALASLCVAETMIGDHRSLLAGALPPPGSPPPPRGSLPSVGPPPASARMRELRNGIEGAVQQASHVQTLISDAILTARDADGAAARTRPLAMAFPVPRGASRSRSPRPAGMPSRVEAASERLVQAMGAMGPFATGFRPPFPLTRPPGSLGGSVARALNEEEDEEGGEVLPPELPPGWFRARNPTRRPAVPPGGEPSEGHPRPEDRAEVGPR